MRIRGYQLHKCRCNYVYDIYAYGVQKCNADMECASEGSPRLYDLWCRLSPVSSSPRLSRLVIVLQTN